MTAKEYAPGEKTHKDENFPVASRLIAPKHRDTILAFYRFARGADDVADHPSLTPDEKVAQLDLYEETLNGTTDAIAEALPLRAALRAKNLTARHGLDLLVAFRMDARKQRYANWEDLMGYCTYSAMPVGRFVLDVHGESRDTWFASDALCAALQVINHLQDCGQDYRRLDRVYIPQQMLSRYGVTEADLGADKASPGLRQCIGELAAKTQKLLGQANLSTVTKDFRLAMEVAVIESVAHRLARTLSERDPLSEKVHLGKAAFAGTAISAIAHGITQRMGRTATAPVKAPHDR